MVVRKVRHHGQKHRPHAKASVTGHPEITRKWGSRLKSIQPSLSRPDSTQRGTTTPHSAYIPPAHSRRNSLAHKAVALLIPAHPLHSSQHYQPRSINHASSTPARPPLQNRRGARYQTLQCLQPLRSHHPGIDGGRRPRVLSR